MSLKFSFWMYFVIFMLVFLLLGVGLLFIIIWGLSLFMYVCIGVVSIWEKWVSLFCMSKYMLLLVFSSDVLLFLIFWYLFLFVCDVLLDFF